jgi:hypothetical protein
MEKKFQKSKNDSNFSSIEKIENPILKESLLYLISEKIVNKNKINWKGDFEKNVKQEIQESIDEKYKDINEKFSELRRSGNDLGVLNFKLMIIPLKIKIFLSTYEKKDAEIIIMRIKEIENEINSIKS